MSNRVGQQLGNYRLERLLGQGGFAEVYLAEHIHLKTQVAIKVLHTTLGDDELQAFLQEAQTVAHLKHPHIVQVYHFDLAERTPYLAMEYLPHGSLRQQHPRGSILPVATVVSYVKQVADALQYAHDEKLIHRDVKPENMLLNQRNEVVLSDFGIATVTQSSRLHDLQEVAGTASYMAPEQFQGKPRRASDQYSLAVVAYEWLCGQRLFRGSFAELASQHLLVAPPSLQEKVPTLPAAVEEVIFVALAKDPQQRFASMQAFARALEQACQEPELLNAVPSQSLSLSSLPLETLSVPSSFPPDPGRLTQQPTTISSTAIHSSSNEAIPAVVTPTEASILAVSAEDKLTGAPPIELPDRSTLLAQQAITRHPKKLPRVLSAILLAVALLVVLGASTRLLYGAIKQHAAITSATATAIARAQSTARAFASATANALAYNSGTANGVMFGFDAAHTYFNPYEHMLSPTNVSRLVPYWTATTGDIVYSSPTVANGIVYVGSYNHKLYAFDARTGRTLWITSAADAIEDSPAVANGVVYAGSYSNPKLYALDAFTSKIIWSASLGDVTSSAPTVANGIVYVASYDKKVYAINAITGKTIWTLTLKDFINSSPAIANGIAYVALDKLYALNAMTGKILWSAPISQADHTYYPAVANGVVYLGITGELYAFNASTGKLLWVNSYNLFLNTELAVVNGIIYAGTDISDKLYAFNAATGKVLWIASTNDSIASPAVANGVVYIGSNDTSLYAFDAVSGKALWSRKLGAAVSSNTVAVADGAIYVGSVDHKLYAFHLAQTIP